MNQNAAFILINNLLILTIEWNIPTKRNPKLSDSGDSHKKPTINHLMHHINQFLLNIIHSINNIKHIDNNIFVKPVNSDHHKIAMISTPNILPNYKN